MAVEPKSAVEQLKKINEERAKLEENAAKIINAAEAELLAKAEVIIAELREIGLHYKLVPGSKAVTRTTNPEKKCPICNFATSPMHDGRAHKIQPIKKPFKDEDLKRMNLVRV